MYHNEGYILLLYLHCFRPSCEDYSVSQFIQNPKATPFALLALLLLAVPLLLTFRKLPSFVFADRSHQLLAEPNNAATDVNDI